MPRGPAQLVLTASVARRYYLDGRSKVEIAEEFALSRFKVARLLEDARTSGLVRIEIGHPGTVDVELSGQLMAALGLRHCVVTDTPDEHPATLREHLGAAAADLLTEIVTDDDVLGLSWARSVSAMATALTELAPVPVVQLTGALARPGVDDSSIELVREVARVGGGPAYFFYAPMAVADAATARALRRQPEVERAFSLIDSVTIAVAGVGAWEPEQSTLFDATGEAERAALARKGVCADVSGVLIDAGGTSVRARLTDRMIGITHAQMAAVPEVIGIVYGPAKVGAALAAVRGGLVDSLVTHSTLATALIAAAARDGVAGVR
ncbi:sugar-binding transcriptional regulator [Pseudonocardia oceani]|uniref:Transcriptional regulator n=1 Tax=Pseudonocardia oceani TaxID=2792013 RepID=A0ABS6UAR6_9PSEU|nr:sugar-binding domain-containing protein [Pseudonocardia oceani]MBW0091106.1 transcriptional regulator [Pseudonocardia oceani]MBW0110813.1 transcriptional regulator [Pseudonocardia oceani]MBW0123790.1 transcriptional regulator [Pseudonocardia oceani]MBW0129332.1 transcriptional regulator [Pseudonocardia oceani]